MTLLELADRCEKATGPDRELDAWVWWQTGALERLCPETSGRPAPLAVGYYSGQNPRIPDDAVTMANVTPAYGCPAYTTSLDAAMTLVPEGWEAAIYCAPPSSGLNTMVQMETEAMRAGIDFAPLESIAPTPALALTAASLRAIASMGSSG